MILITGATGFLGKQLAKTLRARGHSFIGTTTGEPGPDLRCCDITDEDAVSALVRDVQPDTIIHCAALSSVTANKSIDYYRINVIGTDNLLKAAAETEKRPRFVLISTAGVYGNHPVEVLDEGLPPLPIHHYGLSKFAAERLTHTFADRLDFTIVRPFNIIGRGQTPGFIVPKLVEHFAAGAREIRLGNIDVYRDYIDVDTAAEIILRLSELPTSIGQTVNLCTGRGTSLRELIAAIQEVAGYEIEVIQDPAFIRHPEIWRLLGSADRLLGLLGEDAITSKPLQSVLHEMLAVHKSQAGAYS